MVWGECKSRCTAWDGKFLIIIVIKVVSHHRSEQRFFDLSRVFCLPFFLLTLCNNSQLCVCRNVHMCTCTWLYLHTSTLSLHMRCTHTRGYACRGASFFSSFGQLYLFNFFSRFILFFFSHLFLCLPRFAVYIMPVGEMPCHVSVMVSYRYFGGSST